MLRSGFRIVFCKAVTCLKTSSLGNPLRKFALIFQNKCTVEALPRYEPLTECSDNQSGEHRYNTLVSHK